MEAVDLLIPERAEGRVWWYAFERFARRSMHQHAELEVNLVMHGRGSYLLGDRRVDLEPGLLIWLFPAQPHLLVNETEDFAMWIAVWRPAFLQRVCQAEARALQAQAPGERFHRRIAAEDVRRLADLFRQINQRWGESDHHNAGLAFLATSAWQATVSAADEVRSSELHPSVEQAAALLAADVEHTPLPDLADRVGLSPSRLSRLFKRQTGMTLSDYRNRQRIDRFVAHYGRGNRTDMLNAALQAGFGSYAQFHRAFKRHMGCGPAEYRRRLAHQLDEND